MHRLNTRTWGDGPRSAVLVHGMMSDSNVWWQVGPALAERGYRSTAVDLPGHGHTPPDLDATVERFADQLIESVPHGPDLLIAHSMGSFICSLALRQMKPKSTVFVDTPVGASPDVTLHEMNAFLSNARSKRTLNQLASKHPDWHPHDHEVEAAAAARFDPSTTARLMASASGRDFTPQPDIPALMIKAKPSRYVDEAATRYLVGAGWSVESIIGADHLAWFGHLDEFMTILDQWKGCSRPTTR